jgi:hypothetical protein
LLGKQTFYKGLRTVLMSRGLRIRFILMKIQIRFTLMPIQIQLYDADPDPSLRFNVNSNPASHQSDAIL